MANFKEPEVRLGLGLGLGFAEISPRPPEQIFLRWPAGIYRANRCLFKSRFFYSKTSSDFLDISEADKQILE